MRHGDGKRITARRRRPRNPPSRSIVTILALQPDPQRAPAIRQIVSSSPRVDVTLCNSKRQLLETLRAGVPDVILLPPLLSPADERELVAHLRSRADAAHVELILAPFTITGRGPAARGDRRTTRVVAPKTLTARRRHLRR